MGGVLWGIGGVNRCRSHPRYQKTKKLKIPKFGLTPLIHMWAVLCQFPIAGMAEWLRRLTRNQMGSSRVCSNPTRSGP